MPAYAANLAAVYDAFLTAHPPRRLALGGHSWELIETGSGSETVLLLPGGFGVAATSFQYLADLARDYRVVALTYPPELGRIVELADSVAAVLAACSVERAHVVGGSASGAVAQLLARRHPERIATLILAQTGPPRPRRAPIAAASAALVRAMPAALVLALLRAAVLAFLPGDNAEQVFWRGHFAAIVAWQNRAALAARFAALADFDRSCRFASNDLAGWPGRVVIIEAGADGFIPAAERAKLRRLYPCAALFLLPGGRHADSVTDPGPQIAAIRAALTH